VMSEKETKVLYLKEGIMRKRISSLRITGVLSINTHRVHVRRSKT